MDLAIDTGVFIVSVISGGPAQLAGMRANDVITHLDGVAMHTTSDLIRKVLAGYQIGDIVAVTVIRGANVITLSVTLSS